MLNAFPIGSHCHTTNLLDNLRFLCTKMVLNLMNILIVLHYKSNLITRNNEYHQDLFKVKTPQLHEP